MITDTVVFSPY